MPTGVDMLVASMLKAAGVDVEQVKSDLANYGRALGDKITQLDASLADLKVHQEQTRAAVISLAEQLTARHAARGEFSCDTVKGDHAANNRH